MFIADIVSQSPRGYEELCRVSIPMTDGYSLQRRKLRKYEKVPNRSAGSRCTETRRNFTRYPDRHGVRPTTAFRVSTPIEVEQSVSKELVCGMLICSSDVSFCGEFR